MAGRRLNNLIAIAFWENSPTLLLERAMQLEASCYRLPTYCNPSNVLKVHPFLTNKNLLLLVVVVVVVVFPIIGGPLEV